MKIPPLRQQRSLTSRERVEWLLEFVRQDVNELRPSDWLELGKGANRCLLGPTTVVMPTVEDAEPRAILTTRGIRKRGADTFDESAPCDPSARQSTCR